VTVDSSIGGRERAFDDDDDNVEDVSDRQTTSVKSYRTHGMLQTHRRLLERCYDSFAGIDMLNAQLMLSTAAVCSPAAVTG